MKELINGFKKKESMVLIISSIVWTVITHGMMLLNKYSFHDDAVFFNSIGCDITSGRWMLFLMGKVVSCLHQTNLASIPMMNGAFTIIFLVAIMYLIFQGIGIQSNTSIILLSGLVISFPAITGILIFMFTAPYYYFGALIGVIGVYLYFKKKTIVSGFLCSSLIACSIGTYQANIGICVCTILLFLLSEVEKNSVSSKQYIKLLFCNAVICLASLLEYFLTSELFLLINKEVLSSYNGINSFGKTNILGYLKRIALAYYRFLVPHDNHYASMYPNSTKYFYMLFILLSVLMITIWMVQLRKHSCKKMSQIIPILVIFPLVAYIIYVIVDVDSIHCRMAFSEVMIFVLVAWITEKANFPNRKIIFVLRKVIFVCMGIILYLNINYANTCYVKADILQTQTINYFNTLATKIKLLDGYTDETPIVYINNFPREDGSFIGTDYLLGGVSLYPYSENTLLSDHAWKDMMKLWCGFNQPEGNEAKFANDDRVKAMPCYPDDGAISIIDGTIIVKFVEEPLKLNY